MLGIFDTLNGIVIPNRFSGEESAVKSRFLASLGMTKMRECCRNESVYMCDEQEARA